MILQHQCHSGARTCLSSWGCVSVYLLQASRLKAEVSLAMLICVCGLCGSLVATSSYHGKSRDLKVAEEGAECGGRRHHTLMRKPKYTYANIPCRH